MDCFEYLLAEGAPYNETKSIDIAAAEEDIAKEMAKLAAETEEADAKAADEARASSSSSGSWCHFQSYGTLGISEIWFVCGPSPKARMKIGRGLMWTDVGRPNPPENQVSFDKWERTTAEDFGSLSLCDNDWIKDNRKIGVCA